MQSGSTLRDRLQREKLEKLYVQDCLTTIQIAARFGTSSPAILKLMKEYGLPRRTTGGGKT